MNNSNYKFSASVIAVMALVFALAATADVIESWQFNEAAGTMFTGLTNAVGTASWGGNKNNVATTGPGGTPAGALEYTQGTSSSDNVFRNATLTNPNQTNGIFQLDFKYLTADLSEGDATGANVGFGMRDSTGTELFMVRLQKQNSTLRLQTRIDGSNADLVNFGVDILADTLTVRAVTDLDNRLLDVYYTIGTGSEQTGVIGADIGFNPALEFDEVRMTANLNTNDFGANDVITVDYLTISQIPEPASVALMAGALAVITLLRRKLYRE